MQKKIALLLVSTSFICPFLSEAGNAKSMKIKERDSIRKSVQNLMHTMD